LENLASGKRETTERINNQKLNQKENQNVEAPSLLSISRESGFSNPMLSQKQASLAEKGLENRQNIELPICRRLPETGIKGLLECPQCREEGKPIFFATEHDLDLHVKAKHHVKLQISPVLGGQVVVKC